jgi:hypothetical protein
MDISVGTAAEAWKRPTTGVRNIYFTPPGIRTGFWRPSYLYQDGACLKPSDVPSCQRHIFHVANFFSAYFIRRGSSPQVFLQGFLISSITAQGSAAYYTVHLSFSLILWFVSRCLTGTVDQERKSSVSFAALISLPLFFAVRSLTWSVMSQIMMTKALKQLLRPIRTLRNYSQRIAVASTRDGPSNPAQQVPRTKLVQYPYYVPRNTRGSLPVYSEIRNNGTRVLVLIRNVDGNAEVSALWLLL